MIAIDKMRAAFAATPLCQKNWVVEDFDGNGPSMLCAVSALVSFTGVRPREIDEVIFEDGAVKWFRDTATPILRAEYGLSFAIAESFPQIFDAAKDEADGCNQILAICTKANAEEMEGIHALALWEDSLRPRTAKTVAVEQLPEMVGV